MIQLFLVVLLVLISSAIASGTEAALFNVPYGQVLSAVEEDRWGASALKAVKDAPERPIMTIVIVNNISNIVGSMFVGALASEVFSANWMGPFSFALTLTVIVYSEIIPKSLGERYALKIGLFMAGPVQTATRFLLWLILAIELLTRPFIGERDAPAPSEDEIRALTRLGGASGQIEADEDELIQRVFRLNDVSARELMTPISRADTLHADVQISSLRDDLQTLTHSRLPVYGESIDEIMGIVHQRDLLLALARGEDGPVSALCHPATFIPATLLGDKLISHFQASKQHQAIVVDDHGTVLGLVTLEDVLEVLVGDIADETDVEVQPNVSSISDAEAVADAAASGAELNALLGTSLPDVRLGELVVDRVGRIPSAGEEITLEEGIVVFIEEATPRILQKLRFRRIPLSDSASVSGAS